MKLYTLENDAYIITYFFAQIEKYSYSRDGRDQVTLLHSPILHSIKVYIPFMDKFVKIDNDKSLDQKAQKILDESNLEF